MSSFLYGFAHNNEAPMDLTPSQVDKNCVDILVNISLNYFPD